MLFVVAAIAAGCGSGAGTAAPSGTVPSSTGPPTSKLVGLPAKAIVAAALRAARREGSAHVHFESDALGGFVQEEDLRAGRQRAPVRGV